MTRTRLARLPSGSRNRAGYAPSRVAITRSANGGLDEPRAWQRVLSIMSALRAAWYRLNQRGGSVVLLGGVWRDSVGCRGTEACAKAPAAWLRRRPRACEGGNATERFECAPCLSGERVTMLITPPKRTRTAPAVPRGFDALDAASGDAATARSKNRYPRCAARRDQGFCGPVTPKRAIDRGDRGCCRRNPSWDACSAAARQAVRARFSGVLAVRTGARGKPREFWKSAWRDTTNPGSGQSGRAQSGERRRVMECAWQTVRCHPETNNGGEKSKAGLRTREWRILIRRVHAFP